MMRSLFSLCGALPALLIAFPGFAGINALEMTVSTTFLQPTCETTITDSSGTVNSVVNIGDIYLPQVVNKTNFRAFYLAFKNCSGLVKNQASVTLTPRTGCDGLSASGNGFRNALNGSDDAAGVSAEVWTTTSPGSSGSVQLQCNNPVKQAVNVTDAHDDNIVKWPLSARIVIANGNTIADIHTGGFSTQGLFTVTYE
ncbi:fimbrial protein [Citrobacter braakii]|nr:fimbrial protein [Citrobacter braakii]